MAIGQIRAAARPVATQAPAKARATAAAKAPALASDSFRPGDVKVITYNTAIGNPKIKTDQKDFTKLPFYQAALKNAPGAPILCLQEVGNAQRDEVKRLAASGQFHVFSQAVGLRGRQNNMVVIPKRYEVVSYKSDRYGFEHVKAFAKKAWGWVKSLGKEKLNISQMTEPRGFQQLTLKDTVTGKTFSVFNTHTSYYEDIKVAHNKELFDAPKQAAKQHPVIVAGDLNTRTAETDDPNEHWDDQSRAQQGEFKDMGPKGPLPKKTNIDWVLAQGFDSVSSKVYTGDSISLPGSPDALTVSDHYAEEDVLRFK
ncbi:MAG: endonuclease/exonuclease/phosphatase family protein [Candidatus Sericytochromatia bacterium]